MPNVGKYAELADRLADLIKTDYSPRDQFLTNAEIATRYKVSGNTASRAVQLLKERGVLSGKTGGKTWVRVIPARRLRTNENYHAEKQRVRLPEDERRAWGISEASTGTPVDHLAENVMKYDIVAPPPDIAELMDLGPSEKVLRRSSRRRNQHGEGVSVSVSYLPYNVVAANPEILDPSNEPWPGATQHQLYTLGIEVDRIEDIVTATTPTEAERDEQDIPPGVPMLHIRKVTYDTDDRVVEVADIPIPADRIELRFVTRLERW